MLQGEQSVGDDTKDSGVQESGRPDETIQELGEAAFRVLCFGLVTALCEGQRKVGDGTAQVYKDGAGVEGFGL